MSSTVMGMHTSVVLVPGLTVILKDDESKSMPPPVLKN